MSGWGEEENVNESQQTAEKVNGWGADEGNKVAEKANGWGEEDKPKDTNEEPLENEEVPEVYNGLIESVHTVEVKLAEQQNNEKSPLYSIHSFEELGLSKELLEGIYAMKYNKPSKVQEKALPLLLKNPPENMLAQSQSGTGKTAAFTLTMISRCDPEMNDIQAICVTPTRELTRQNLDVCKKMGAFTKVTVNTTLRDETAGFSRPQPIKDHIIIGTPGSIMEMHKRRLIQLDRVKIIVFDEADVMLDKQGMGDQSIRVRRLCPEECQVVLFSATFKPAVKEFASRILVNPNEITLRQEELSVDSIRQYWMDCMDYRHKFEYYIRPCKLGYPFLIISQTRNTAEEVQRHMTADGHVTSVLHGGLEVAERDRVIDEFRNGVSKVLITTNVLARGIDILQVNLVINFDLPIDLDRNPDFETYIHRIGRTGRFGRSGVSINFVHDRRSHENMLKIQEYLGREIVQVPTANIDVLERKLKGISTPTTTAKFEDQVPLPSLEQATIG